MLSIYERQVPMVNRLLQIIKNRGLTTTEVGPNRYAVGEIPLNRNEKPLG